MAESPLVSLYPSEGGAVDGGDADIVSVQCAAVGESLVFPLERYLEDFLVSKWDKTPLGRTLPLHTKDEESVTQYSTDLGPIDILARDRASRDWVVIELKRERVLMPSWAGCFATWGGSRCTWQRMGKA